jgi:gluconolactonase
MKESLSNSLIILACTILMTACASAHSNEIVAEGEVPVRLADSYSFTEGPATDARGNVYFTDQPNNKIYRWDCESGEITLFTDQSGRSNGMYFDAQGNLIACADMDNQLWRFDMRSTSGRLLPQGRKNGQAEILITDYRGKLLNGPNDVWISKDGSYYLTDPYFKRDYWTRNPERQQPVEGLYYLAPEGKQLVMLDSTLNQPNGLVGTPDGKHLYVAEARANRILRYDIQTDGSLSNRQVFANMGSDGMTIDDRGNIYLTGDGVTVFDKNGQQIAHFPIPEDWTANVCFGGKERNILFITASKSVYTLKMLVHGLK